MKTIYSLQEFRNEVLKLAEKVGKTYTSCRANVDHNGNISFDAYIDGYSWYSAPKMEDLLAKIKDAIEPPIQNSATSDVEIEIPESEIVTENVEEK